MGRIAEYLKARLGIKQLGQEIGSLRAMQLTFREREAKEFEAARAQAEQILVRLAQVSQQVEQSIAATREIADSLRGELRELGTKQSRSHAVLTHAEVGLQQLRNYLHRIQNIAEMTRTVQNVRSERILNSLAQIENLLRKNVTTTLDAAGQLQRKIAGDLVGIERSVKEAAHSISTLADVMPNMHGSLSVTGANLNTRLDLAVAQVESQVARALGQVDSHLARSARMDAQHLAWAKDTAQMIGEMRSEVRLFMNTPSGSLEGSAGPESDNSDDPKLLRDYVRNSKIREVYPTELFDGFEKLSLPIASINEKSGHGNQVDLMYVAAIAKARKARNIFEFGTYIGRTTYHLTFASKDAHVTTLNLPPEADSRIETTLGMMFRGTDRESRITQLLQDSARLDPAPYAGKMDFIFIDADHSYELVKSDTEKALVMLKPGGAVVWHDYAIKSPGVVRYIQEFSQQRPVFRIRHTCLIVYIDGIDAMMFEPIRREGEKKSRRAVEAGKRLSVRAGRSDEKKAAAS